MNVNLTVTVTVTASALGLALLLPAGSAAAEPAAVPGLSAALAQLRSGTGPAALPGPVRVVRQTRTADGAPRVEVVTAARDRAAGVLREVAARPGTTGVELDTVVSATADPGDPLRPQQWPLRGLGAPALWSVPGAGDVVVAVVDSGVAASHPDLAGVVLPGHDLVADGGDGTADGDGHGTHVAGTIAANQGDGIGVAGVRPGTRVLPIRVLDDRGDGFSSDVADGIRLAVDEGADVINLSLGGPGRSTSVATAVTYALDHGVVVVAASGNERQDGDPVVYPAAQVGVIAVAATERSGAVAPYSSTGSNVAVAAPGSDVLSTVPGGWAFSSGTSMAAPQVSAVVAAMLAVRPDLTPAQVRSTLMQTAADIAPAGWDRSAGAGRVQPLAALRALGADPRAQARTPQRWVGLPRDLDADGRTDLLATTTDGALARYRADGTGGVAGRAVAGSGWRSMDLVTSVGDWDGDGRADVVARRTSDAALLLFRGDGRGGWLGTRVIGTGWSGVDTLLSPSDLDGDGRADLVARRTDGALVLYPGGAGGAVQAGRRIGTGWGGLSALAVLGDWDDDGAADLAARDASGTLWLYPGDGAGGFGVRAVLGTGWGSVSQLVGPGDWDGDGRPDLLAVTTDGTLRSYRSDGVGGFAGVRTIGTGWSSVRLAR